MRVPISWLREFVAIPADQTGRQISDALIRLGLEVETVDVIGEVSGPVVIGQVKSIEELTEFKKPIRMCQVDVGEANGGVRGIVCGARNFTEGDTVVVALPGAVLPGGFEIAARKTYGQVSDGMICSERELGLGEGHEGIMVLDPERLTIGQPAGDVLGFGEEVLDIAVTPDRGYALSIRGVAREAAIAYELPLKDHVMELADLPAPASSSIPVSCSFDDPTACDVFTLRTITGVNAKAQTPAWMSSRLIAAGMRPVSLIVDITNYVMLSTGQPLHAFDLDKLQGGLVARRAQSGEKLTTLDHVDRALDSEDLVIADDSGPLALAGTMGGLSSEISDDSTNIVLEAAHFDAVVVARMSRRHKLSSEASRRFERGIDRQIAPYASGLATELILRYAGGEYVGMTAEEASVEPRAITITGDLPQRVAGMDISRDTTIENLTAVGCTVLTQGDSLVVDPPSWRPDLTDPADLVEEVIRLKGYDQLPSRLPSAPPGRGLTTEQQLRRKVSRYAASLGLTEVLNYPFIGQADLDKCGIPKDDIRRQAVRLANPLSDEQPEFRTGLLPGMLACARRNYSRGAESLAIFEIGAIAFAVQTSQLDRVAADQRPSEVQLKALNAALPVQKRQLGALMYGDWEAKGWWGAGRPVDWSDAIRLATDILGQLGLSVEVRASDLPPLHPGRGAQLRVGGVIVGYAGELHPRVCPQWDLPTRVCGFAIDLDEAIALAHDLVPHGPSVRTFPVAKEDVAVVVDESVPAAEVQQALAEGAGDLLESIRLFDVYTGSQIGEGKKSLAFALRFRAPDRTLEVAEVTVARESAVAQANTKYGAVLRG